MTPYLLLLALIGYAGIKLLIMAGLLTLDYLHRVERCDLHKTSYRADSICPDCDNEEKSEIN